MSNVEITQLSVETGRVHMMHDSTLSLYNSNSQSNACWVWETASLQLPNLLFLATWNARIQRNPFFKWFLLFVCYSHSSLDCLLSKAMTQSILPENERLRIQSWDWGKMYFENICIRYFIQYSVARLHALIFIYTSKCSEGLVQTENVFVWQCVLTPAHRLSVQYVWIASTRR